MLFLGEGRKGGGRSVDGRGEVLDFISALRMLVVLLEEDISLCFFLGVGERRREKEGERRLTAEFGLLGFFLVDAFG